MSEEEYTSLAEAAEEVNGSLQEFARSATKLTASMSKLCRFLEVAQGEASTEGEEPDPPATRPCVREGCVLLMGREASLGAYGGWVCACGAVLRDSR